MGLPSRFHEVWSGKGITTVPPEPASVMCPKAEELHAYAQEFMGQLANAPTPEQVYEKLLLLQRRYFRLLEQTTKAHRAHRSRRGHVCLHAVYETAFYALEAILLRIDPPLLTTPPVASVAEKPQATWAEELVEKLTSA